MLRSVFWTIFIVSVIYASLLWINGFLSFNGLMTDENHKMSSKTEQLSTVKESSQNKTPTTRFDLNDSSNQQKNASDFKSKPRIQSFPITGISKTLDLKSSSKLQNQIEKAWDEFSKADALHAAMNWDKGENDVYAYIYNIDQNYSKADMVIGYELDSLNGYYNVIVPAGRYIPFQLNQSAYSSDAWAKVSPTKNLLERYTVDTKNQLKPIDVLLIESVKD